MNNKRNVIVMFLFVMLSFAIISEVSAVSNAEPDGTGFDSPMKSVDMTNHDFAGERDNMQNHDNDFVDDFRSHNEQNSFNNSPKFDGDKNIENENLYKQEGIKPEPMNNTDQFNGKPFNENERPMPNGNETLPMNYSDQFNGDKPLDFNENERPMNFNQSFDLKPMEIPNNNNSLGMNPPRPIVDGNATNPHDFDAQNASTMMPHNIPKTNNNLKIDKKSKNNKNYKKTNNFKINKKSKNKNTLKKVMKSKRQNKKSKMERAKL